MQSIIQTVESDPNYFFDYTNYDVTLNFIESIRVLVNTQTQGMSQTQSVAPMATYQLQDNWVKDANGDWVSSGGYWGYDYLWNYNCYAFAIDMTVRPPQYTTTRQYQPGDFAGTGRFTSNISIYNLALIVKADLLFLGYDNVSVDLTAPNLSTLGSDEKLISIRRTITNSLWQQDYHFMKYETDGYWYHKPGFSAILKYKYHPGLKNWIYEISSNGIESSDVFLYNSDVYYIRYSKQPFTTSISGGNATITGVKQGITLTGSVTIPSTVVVNETINPVIAIGNSAFSNQTQLSQITIPASVISIGNNAFQDCDALTTVYVERSFMSGITTLGSNAFYNCPNLASIYVPESASLSEYKNATNWSSYQSLIKTLTFTVTFDKKGGTGGDFSVSATYGSDMPNAIMPTKGQYIFGGYCSEPSGQGRYYYNLKMSSVRLYDIEADTTLYAIWLPGYPEVREVNDNFGIYMLFDQTIEVILTFKQEGIYLIDALQRSIGSVSIEVWDALSGEFIYEFENNYIYETAYFETDKYYHFIFDNYENGMLGFNISFQFLA